MKRNTHFAVAITAAVILSVTGCGSSGDDSTEPAAQSSNNSPSEETSPSPSEEMSPSPSESESEEPESESAVVTIKDFAYDGPASVGSGAKIDVTNEDSSSHTLTSDQSGEFDVTIEADGSTANFVAPTKPGKYPYHCTFHGDMTGTLVVK